jgi:hypothetical protein
MKSSRNYDQAKAQVQDRIEEAEQGIEAGFRAMNAGRPGEAVKYLKHARDALDGALVTAQWATTLPEPEEE